MCRPMIVLLVLLSLLGVASRAHAERQMLTPPLTQVAIRINVMGFIPVDGTFDRFDGWLDFDPARPGTCQIRLRIETASLSTASETVREDAIGPGFLDSARFPVIAYEGSCDGDAILGRLDMHGVTRPFALGLTFGPAPGLAAGLPLGLALGPDLKPEQPGRLAVATGSMRRSEWVWTDVICWSGTRCGSR